MYAILDIETTGGKYNEEGITEIAIYKFDGHEVVDHFSSLVNPERKIQAFVVNLTGINNNMLRTAPKFYEVAKRIVEITEGCILVAHNAKFDTRILSTEFRRLGFEYQRKSICTVQLSQELLPDMASYSLGKLTKALGIPITDRHRAQGDALATVSLFKLLLSKDVDKNIVSTHIALREEETPIKTKLLKLVESVPAEIGVYYLHAKDASILYIGHSKNMRKRINQHFTSKSAANKNIQKKVVEISFALTGNMLIASLKADEDILSNKPKYTRRSKKQLCPYQLVQHRDKEGYVNLRIEKSDLRKRPLLTFHNLATAKQNLVRISQEFSLCPEKNDLKQIKIGDKTQEVPVKEYNARVKALVEKYVEEKQTHLLIDKGREVGEHSVIYIKNGVYQGYGFYSLNHQINKVEILEKILVPPTNQKYARHIIDNYLLERNVQKVLPLSKDKQTF